MVSDHPKITNPSKYIHAVNHPKKNGLDKKYSISLAHTRLSDNNLTHCLDAAVIEILDVEVTQEMFLSLSRGEMVVAASPQTEESCQVSHIIFVILSYAWRALSLGVTCGSSTRISLG